MDSPSKTDLKVLSFPKAPAPAEMDFDYVRLRVTEVETNAAIEFLNAHAEEFPATPANLLSLIWIATRTLLQLGVPGAVAQMMLDRALTWVSKEVTSTHPTKPKPKKKP